MTSQKSFYKSKTTSSTSIRHTVRGHVSQPTTKVRITSWHATTLSHDLSICQDLVGNPQDNLQPLSHTQAVLSTQILGTTSQLDLPTSQTQLTNISLNLTSRSRTLLVSKPSSQTGTRTLTSLRDNLSALLALKMPLTVRETVHPSSQAPLPYLEISDRLANKLLRLFLIISHSTQPSQCPKSLFQGPKPTPQNRQGTG
jgi:hypothetical protein